MEYKTNLNYNIRVKLLKKGYERLAKLHNELSSHFPIEDYRPEMGIRTAKYYYGRTDEEGYSTFQLWHFIQIFGPVTNLNTVGYYETEIILEGVEPIVEKRIVKPAPGKSKLKKEEIKKAILEKKVITTEEEARTNLVNKKDEIEDAIDESYNSFHDELRALCNFQLWLGENYNTLPTNSTEMTRRARNYYLQNLEEGE